MIEFLLAWVLGGFLGFWLLNPRRYEKTFWLLVSALAFGPISMFTALII